MQLPSARITLGALMRAPNLRMCQRVSCGALGALLACAIALSVAGCRLAPRYDATNTLRTPASARLSDASEAIFRAGRKLGWEVEIVRPGELMATLRHHGHVAVVDITHDLHRFQIRYRNSQNLLVDGDRIHENYNVWIQRLEAKIREEPIYPTESK